MECACVEIHGRLHEPCDFHGKWAGGLRSISAYCHTNLDAYKREQWPGSFLIAPKIGDRIESGSGKWLKVVGLTHSMTKDGQPHLSVELHN